VASFYRRSLEFFLVYLGLGILGLKSAAGSIFPNPAGCSWNIFSDRYPHLGLLALAPPTCPAFTAIVGPHLAAATGVSLFLRGLLLFLLVVIILADLLGFQNLSMYLPRRPSGPAGRGDPVVLWLMGETIIRHLCIRKPAGPVFLSGRAALIQRIYVFSRWSYPSSWDGGGSVVLNSWGIAPHQVAGLSVDDLGSTLGPLKLTTLNVAAPSWLSIWGSSCPG